MSEISEAARAKAGELLLHLNHHDNCTASPDHPGECGCGLVQDFAKVARFIQQVSDTAKFLRDYSGSSAVTVERVAPFVLPEPVDPLYEALHAVVELGRYDTREQTELLRGELKARGLEIRPVSS